MKLPSRQVGRGKFHPFFTFLCDDLNLGSESESESGNRESGNRESGNRESDSDGFPGVALMATWSSHDSTYTKLEQ